MSVSRKNQKIAEVIASHQGQDLNPHYLGYFDCFNQQLFFEAHEVLEELWLPDRHGPNGAFYKGLIQLAGAFVHLQKRRRGPAAALFKLALANLAPYPAIHEQLELKDVLELIEGWLQRLQEDNGDNLLKDGGIPRLRLRSA
jgi:predicted metal-dependent hydrolase